MRPYRRMNCPKRYSTNNMNQNQGNDTVSEPETIKAQDMDNEKSLCEELYCMYEKNYEYMKSLYPSLVRKVQKAVDEECDKLEHTGSPMFDEWPDKTQLDAIIDAVYNRMQYLDKDDPELQTEELAANPLTALELSKAIALEGMSVNPIPDYTALGRPNWFRNMILAMLYNEMLYRRIRYYNRRYNYPKFY
ncbi:MAG: hypothetical protein Q4F05_16595 [bacterium]|nr:hypothetical protein [bacterium]